MDIYANMKSQIVNYGFLEKDNPGIDHGLKRLPEGITAIIYINKKIWDKYNKNQTLNILRTIYITLSRT